MEWISVEERLPETDDEVLVWYEYLRYADLQYVRSYGLARYTDTNIWSCESGTWVKVLYWMPLPKAPTHRS